MEYHSQNHWGGGQFFTAQTKRRLVEGLFWLLLFCGPIYYSGQFACDLYADHLVWLEQIRQGADFVVFSNDGPLGTVVSEQNRMPGYLTSQWIDAEHLGRPGLALPSAVSAGFRMICNLFSFPLLTFVVVGVCACIYFGKRKPLLFAYLSFNVSCMLVLITTVTLGVCGQLEYDSAWFGASSIMVAFFPFQLMGAMALAETEHQMDNMEMKGENVKSTT